MTKPACSSNSVLISRRALLKSSAAVLVGGQTWQAIPRGALAEEPSHLGDPLFTFAQINDTHIQAPFIQEKNDDTPVFSTYARANDKFKWLIGDLNRKPQPDFIVGIGDLIHGQQLERLEPDLELLAELLKPLGPKLYPTLGNHEVVQQEGSPEYERAYRKMFGDDRVSYSFEHGGILFVMLNNSGATVVSDEIVRARNAWLCGVLEEHPNQPKILCCHIPIAPVRDDEVLAQSFGFPSYHAHDDELLGLVDAHAKSIIAVLSGHLHLTGYVTRNDVYHISICGTASYPSDYARFRVYKDRLEMQVCQLPEELRNAAPSIHGKKRHGREYTDKNHRTADEYQIGRGDERRLTIPRKLAT